MNRLTKAILLILFVSNNQVFAQNIPNTNNTNPVPTFYGIPGSSNSVPLITPYNSGGNTDPSVFNYIRVFTPQVPLTNSSLINETSDADQVKESTTYYDGLGRVIQVRDRYAANPIRTLVSFNDYRPAQDRYSFLPYSSSSSHFDKTPSQDQAAFYNLVYPNEQNVSASRLQYQSNSYTGARSLLKYSPGKTNFGQDRGVETIINLNVSNEVFVVIINESTQIPQKVGYYDAGTLSKKTIGSSDGSLIHEYIDKNGKLLLRRVLVKYEECSGTGSGGGSSSSMIPPPPAGQCPYYIETYFVYDEFDRLRYTVSPKAVNILSSNGWVFNSYITENLCDYRNYDYKNRLIESHRAGENGKEVFVYDKHDRIVLSKSPGESLWRFSLYNRHSRVTVTGTTNISHTRSDWQDIMDNGLPGGSSVSTNSLEYYLLYDDAQGLYPTTLPDCEILSYIYYDGYPTNGFFNQTGLAYDGTIFSGSYLISGSYPTITTNTLRTKGMVTGTKIKVLKPYSGYTDASLLDWISTVNYYDDNGRLVQKRQLNHRNGVEVASMQYDYTGRILRTIIKHENPSSLNKTGATLIKTDYYYLAKTKQLSRITQQIDNGPTRDIVTYNYNMLGQIREKVIGGTIESQSLDYNIRGQLTGINSNYALSSITSNPIITFGESIRYDNGFNGTYYNGKISGILWRGPGTSKLKSYGYNYDYAGRLLGADYREYCWYKSNPTTWTLDWNNYYADYSENEIDYDFNGNITKLKRYGPTNSSGVITPNLIDDLTYSYEDNDASNRLKEVSDAIPITGQITDYDFKENGVGSGNNYQHDDNGNLIVDNYKGISIVNNPLLNKPSYIDFSNGDRVSFVYDAAGNKLVEKYSGTKNEKNDFFNSFTYKDDNLELISNSEGYALYRNLGFHYYFFVKDHLGNVRHVLDANLIDYGTVYNGPKDVTYKVGFESAVYSAEKLYAASIDPPIRVSKPNSTDPIDLYCAELDANLSNQQIGSMIMLKVMAGDSFLLSGDCYHQCPDAGTFNPLSGEEFITSLIASINGPGGVEGGAESVQGQILNGMFTNIDFYGLYEEILNTQTVAGRPKSYLNYLFFDEDFNLLKDESGVLQIKSTEATWENVVTNSNSQPFEIGNSGYLVVFTSNMDRSVKAYWDNISLTKYRGKIVDENHYYPYGVTINLSSSNSINNRYLFSTNKLDKTNGLHLYDFHARQYNPQLGIFHAIDPLKEFHSGYTYCADNPVSATDKFGLSSYEGSFPNSPHAPIQTFYRGAGIKGGGPVGFSMSESAIRDGYAAYDRAARAEVLGELGGVVVGGIGAGGRRLSSAEAAAIESGEAVGGAEGAAARRAASRETSGGSKGRVTNPAEVEAMSPGATASRTGNIASADAAEVGVGYGGKPLTSGDKAYIASNTQKGPISGYAVEGDGLEGFGASASKNEAKAVSGFGKSTVSNSHSNLASQYKAIEFESPQVSIAGQTNKAEETVSLYRNFGWNEYNSFRANNNRFIIDGKNFGGKQFWMNESGLEFWKKTEFSKQFTVEVTIPKDVLNFGVHGQEASLFDYITFPDQASLNQLNNNMKINGFKFE